MNDNQQEAREKLRAFVLELNPDLDRNDLRDDTPLISSRLITSNRVLDLLLLVESLRCAPIDPRSLVPASFSDIDAIARHLLPMATG